MTTTTSNAAAAAATTAATRMQYATPPSLFAIVEDDVYRSAYPSSSHGRFLQGLGLRTVVSLSLEGMPMQARRMLEGQGARYVALGAAGWATKNNFDQDLLIQALQLVLNADNHPVLLMCATGELQTTAVVGALRKLQGWCLASIDGEAQAFQSSAISSHHTATLEAIERFDAKFFYASVVQPRILAQRTAMAAIERWRLEQAQRGAAPLTVTAADGTPVLLDGGTESVATMIDAGFHPGMAAPLPLWYLRGVRHMLAFAREMQLQSAATDEELTDAGVAATVRQHRPVGARSARQQAPHEQYRFASLAPSISDPDAYNKAECLVESDDD
jgi:tyrosine-protein phosphatase OCA1